MQFSAIKLFSAVLLFTSTAAAFERNGCMCLNGGEYGWEMTRSACQIYDDNDQRWGRTVYDDRSQECFGGNGGGLDDVEWHSACREVARNGWECRDSSGGCISDPRQANIWCEN